MNDTPETKQCSNCKIDILSSNYVIHSIHCHRNFFICSKCQERVNHNEKSEHENSNHVVVQCEYCNFELEKYCLVEHLANDCPYRAVNCQICGIEVKATDITEHEDYCGSRTEKCLECGQFVMLKYKTLHTDSDHIFIKLPDEPGPSPSWQNGRRTLFNFMPDLTKKSCTKSSNQRKKFRSKISSGSIGSGNDSVQSSSQENNSVSSSDSIEPCSETKCDEKPNQSIGTRNELNKKNFHWTNKKDNIGKDFKLKAEVLNIEKTEKQLEEDFDDWPPLSDFSSLRISNDMQNDSRSSVREPSPVKRSDYAFALKVCRELNGPLSKNKVGTGKGESCNSSSSSSRRPGVKDLQENLNACSKEEKVEVRSCDSDSGDDFLLNAYKEVAECRDEEVTLPCEFCGASILSDDLILHQSGCYKFLNESINDFSKEHNSSSYLIENEDVEIPCEICNESFKLSLLKEHEIRCNRNLLKALKNEDRKKIIRNIKPVKSLPGIQNGVEVNYPRLSGVGTRSEWLTDLSTATRERRRDSKKNLNQEEQLCSKTSKFSHNDRSTPSPTTM